MQVQQSQSGRSLCGNICVHMWHFSTVVDVIAGSSYETLRQQADPSVWTVVRDVTAVHDWLWIDCLVTLILFITWLYTHTRLTVLCPGLPG